MLRFSWLPLPGAPRSRGHNIHPLPVCPCCSQPRLESCSDLACNGTVWKWCLRRLVLLWGVIMSFKVTENIMTVESLLELPHKLLMGNLLLPDMDQVLWGLGSPWGVLLGVFLGVPFWVSLRFIWMILQGIFLGFHWLFSGSSFRILLRSYWKLH